ncbi:MAG: relaxase/mobilization nuclease domain-containing protein [Flavobacteriales bacterium]|jgi:hypothetical protein|nr:relaxase/mobilization nuclease domain-containing protein [Flavobacteriales bacterium]
MIIKSKSHKGRNAFKTVIEYMFKEDHNAEFVYKKLLRTQDKESWVRQYEACEGNRQIKRSNGIKLHHEIMSFNPKDTESISRVMLKDFAKKYVQLRNPKALSLVVAHFEKNHVHLHFCFSAIDYGTGKSNRLSRKEFSEVKQNIQKYQLDKYPELEHSLVNHSKSKKKTKISEKEMQMRLRIGEVSEKEQLYYKVQSIFHASPDIPSFVHTLKHNGIEPYIRNGKLTGIHYGNRKYRFKTLGIKEDMILEKSRIKSKKRNQELNR